MKFQCISVICLLASSQVGVVYSDEAVAATSAAVTTSTISSSPNNKVRVYL